MKMDWEIIQLGDLCEFKNGLWKGKNPPYVSSKVIRMTNFTKECEMNNIMPVELEVEERQFSSRSLIDGDLILEKSGGGPKQPVGRVVRFIASNNDNYSFSNFTTRIRVANLRKVDSKYLHKYLKFFYLMGKTIPLQSNSTGIRNLQLPAFREILIPVPSLEIQKQIVAKLDEVFAAIDTAKLNIEKNLENAKELFQSKLSEIFSQKGEGWVEKKLGDICIVLNGYAFKSKDAINSSKTQLLRMGNLYQNQLDLTRKPVYYPDRFLDSYEEYVLKSGDLVMSLTGTAGKRDYGYTVEIPETEVNLILNQRIMKISMFDNSELLKSYLYYFLQSPNFLDKLYLTSNGTRQGNLSSKVILSLIISFPESIKNQNAIVSIIKSLKENTKLLESKYQQELNSLEELKKSILEKAVAGEL